MKLHQKQREIAQSKARFKIIRAGRKGGKTAYERESIGVKATISIDKMSHLSKKVFDTGRKVIYIAPTQAQARKIVWEALKSRYHGLAEFNEQRLEMKIKNEDDLFTTVFVGGWENRENYRGLTDVVHITFDEIDSLKDFFIAWADMFRPMFLDTRGTADFIGTPNNRNPNLRRLEKEAETKEDWECFHFTSKDNPFLPIDELAELAKEYEGNTSSYKQEILAEHIDDSGALFRYNALVDMFSNTLSKSKEKFLTVDIADDGTDKTIFTFWNDLEVYRIEMFERLNTEMIISQIREYAAQDQIPFSQITVDAIGVGAGVASSSLLDGVVAYKSSYSPFKIDRDEVKLPNVHYTKDAPRYSEYRNLRSQCVFTLAQLVNDHKIAIKTDDVRIREQIIEELSTYQDASTGDGKRFATPKEHVKELIGRSPDLSDTLLMRMYFHLKRQLDPYQSENEAIVVKKIMNQFDRNEAGMINDSTR